MNIKEIKAKLKGEDYSFLKSNSFLGENVILLGLGGSHAYGTNIEGSDLDIRGIATNSKRFILTGQDFEQIVDNNTDTTIYSLNKIMMLLSNCNPNVIEILGLKPEHYFCLTKAGSLILDNKDMFLTRRASYTFGSYANAQLRRLENKSSRATTQEHQEEHILQSIKFASDDYKRKYFPYSEDSIKLFIDKSLRTDYDSEIFADINLSHYPLRDFKDIANDMNNIIKDYSKIGKRNENAIKHDKLSKHMMHLVRLYLMCFDILEKKEINTYRDNDHDFLMSIRGGKFLDKDDQPISEFYEMVNEYEKRLKYDADNTDLPEKVDSEAVYDLMESINKEICSCN